MDPLIAALIAGVVGLVIGAVVAWLVAVSLERSKTRIALTDAAAIASDSARAAAEAASQQQENAIALLLAQHATALAEERARAERGNTEIRADLAAALAQVDELRGQVDVHKAREQAENVVLQQLAPVKSTLEAMQKKVVDLETQRAEQHVQLTQQLLDTRQAGEQIRQSAAQLREVLKSNSTRGRWGELQLRSVVEAAGMLDKVNFDMQASLEVDGKAVRPDMVIHLPGGKTIAVDSKVPFNAYSDALDIPITASEVDQRRRDDLLKQHVAAVRKHITDLSAKSYWSALDVSPEMVVAFIPSESLLAGALEADPDILEFAFAKHVVLASPVTLFSVLKAIAVSWTHEEMSKEARGLFEVSRTLYTRLVTLAKGVDKLGRSLTTSVKDYNDFVGSLERSVLPAARRISRLDETKVLPDLRELDADVREINGSDLAPQLAIDGLDGLDGLDDLDETD